VHAESQRVKPEFFGLGRQSFGFIALCAIAFSGSFAATIYFCRSLCCEMEMPGGWTMSMMWMRMHGQTWLASAANFMLMWLAMMVAMMLPSALPMFLRTRREWTALCFVTVGYFFIWFVAGAGIYLLGAALAAAAMQLDFFSRAVPWLLGTWLIAAGAIQFTRWKTTHLRRCRSPLGCAVSCAQDETSFRLGCKQGVACCVCCASLMTIQLALGIMNPLVMIAVALAVAAEKFLPHPVIVARVIGISALVTGFATLVFTCIRN
jgi:predicted metal-binding membrane protein